MGGAIAMPGGDTVRQDALNGASVEVQRVFKGQAIFLQPSKVEKELLHLHHAVCVKGTSL